MANHTSLRAVDISLFAADLKVAIISTEWNAQIVGLLLESCKAELKSAGLHDSQVLHYEVPGAFELPLGARLVMEHNKCDAVICLGCVIKGETTHDEHINRSVSSALMQLGLMSDIPVIFGVLTTGDEDQAKARAGGNKGDKGKEAAISALKMIELKKSFSKNKKKIGY